MRMRAAFSKLWVRLAVWFAVILVAFFIVLSVVYTALDEILMTAMTDAEQEAYFAASDRLLELDPVSEGATILLMFAVIVPMSIIAGALVARRITRPITNVGDVAQQVVNGQLSARATPPKNQPQGEIGVLVANVNTLLDTVQASHMRVKADAAAIAHELRTPLAALQMKLHGMIDGVVAVSDEELQRLLAQCQVLSRVVDDLRTLSLITHGELRLLKTRTNLLTLARSSLEMHAKPLEAAGIRAAVDGTPVVTFVDPDRINQALSNLIENAIRYASDGDVLDVHVSQSGDTCEMRVSDRGPGLEVSFRSVVFEPFAREEASRSREFGGSGLGLSIVKAIAEAHGGSVRADARTGGGLDIVLQLPLTENAPLHETSTQPTAPHHQ